MKMDARHRKEPAADPALARMSAGQLDKLGEMLATLGVAAVRVKMEQVGGAWESSTRFDRAPAIPGRPASVDAVAHIAARAVGDIMRLYGVESLELTFAKEDAVRLADYYKDAAQTTKEAAKDEEAG